MWWLPVLGLVVGLVIGFWGPFHIPVEYAKYVSVAVLVALDAIVGGIRAYQKDAFDEVVFLSGFVSNILLATLLAFIGDRIGVDLYLAAVVTFGARLFQNISIIRRHVIGR